MRIMSVYTFERVTELHSSCTETRSSSGTLYAPMCSYSPSSVHEVEKKYYADGEDAYMMKKVLQPSKVSPDVPAKSKAEKK